MRSLGCYTRSWSASVSAGSAFLPQKESISSIARESPQFPEDLENWMLKTIRMFPVFSDKIAEMEGGSWLSKTNGYWVIEIAFVDKRALYRDSKNL